MVRLRIGKRRDDDPEVFALSREGRTLDERQEYFTLDGSTHTCNDCGTRAEYYLHRTYEPEFSVEEVPYCMECDDPPTPRMPTVRKDL